VADQKTITENPPKVLYIDDDGQIWIESERQDAQSTPGSSFYLFLPIDGPQQ
jgi:hypothetical protein